MERHPYNIELLPPTFSPWAPAKPPSRRIAVLMSGGVDSSIAAYLLKRAGWDVLGVTMKIPVACDAGGRRGCCGADAAFVCGELGLPHYFIDVTEAFDRLIIQSFRDSYSRGLTPNPCVDCNTFLKFDLVWDILRQTFGIRRLATGHYASVVRQDGHFHLCRAQDEGKDQSYFLYGISARRLAELVLPLGSLTKRRVREMARRLNLSVADKPESMELCFAAERDYRFALHADDACRPGDVTDMQGRKIGEHKGIANYTIGQRKGVGVAAGQPLYVSRVDPATDTVALATRGEMMTRVVGAEQVNVLVPDAVAVGQDAYGKIRSYGQPKACVITQRQRDRIKVTFAEPEFAPCPGQRLVLYDRNGNVICGGTITASWP